MNSQRLTNDGIKDGKVAKLFVGHGAERTISVAKMFDLFIVDRLTIRRRHVVSTSNNMQWK